jgi:hypothetical protein
MNQFSPSLRVSHYDRFKFFRKFAEIFATEANLPQVSTTSVAKFATSFASVDTGGKFATGVNDTGGKFVAGVNNAGNKFPTGINNTGGKFATGVNDTGQQTADNFK